MLEVEGLTVTYGDTVAVDDLSLEAGDGEVLGIIGPSGCGKSTILRAIAGLVPVRSGHVRIDGEAMDGRRPDQRRVGLMFQDHALFPHRTVADNVGFGPRMHGLPRGEIAARVAAALDLVDLAGTEDRHVTELSGGEQQRVALARAIAPRPRLLMLDEPLGSLDRALRDRLLDDLPQVFADIGTTVVYVTHDQGEALQLCDRIAVMRRARVEQVGPPDRLWRAPANAFVARFLGLDHVLDAEVVDGVADTRIGRIPVDGAPDGPTTLVLHADALRLLGPGDEPGDGEITIRGSVVERRFAGDHTRVHVAGPAGGVLSVAVWRGPDVGIGDQVVVGLDPRAVHRLDGRELQRDAAPPPRRADR